MASPPPSGSLHPPPPRRRWRLRYGLRTFLLTICALSIVLGVIGNWWIGLQRQRRIVARIEAMGGDVRYGYEFGMGDDLEPVMTYSRIHSLIIHVEEGRRSRTRITPKGNIVEVESPPGPDFLAPWIGSDAFAAVEAVEFTGSFQPGERLQRDADFGPSHLLALPQLRVLWLTEHQVSDQWLKQIARVPKLEVLNLGTSDESSITSGGLASLKSAPQLKCLGLSGSSINDKVIEGVANLEHLECLNLFDVPSVGSSALFQNIKHLTGLRELTVFKAKGIDDCGTAPLRQFHQLQTLRLPSTSISDPTIAHLAGLKNLEWVDLSDTNVGDAGIRHLAGLSQLQCLLLSGTQVGDEGLETISTLAQVKELNLGKTSITDDGMQSVAKMSQLERLDLWPTAIQDQGILRLKLLKNLRDLTVGPHISKEAANELRRALPKCIVRRLNENGTGIWPE